ncbi:ESX secretion-associated protein EspG [Saccharothrix syringae]|uniref:ESX secretion-associated protein EspG n=1 Tax=Saccharothrix syringae TaxID=103733 RepID=A0A5Q0GVE8_SACSY|nr:ESX secretion-associated protein EspG [Saccharothrix syringae]QFZ17595.1 ESX secretion-associated protein EspG [Saccharothrix syringae]
MTVTLSRLEFELCWDHLGLGEQPTILAIPSHGATLDERRALFHGAWDGLRARGLVERGAVDAGLAGWLDLLARPEREVDARLRLDAGPRVRAVAAARRRHAVLAVLTADGLRLTRVDEGSLAASVVSLLPPHTTPRSRSISLPAAVLDHAAAVAGESATRLERALCDGGLPRPDARKVGSVLGNVVRMGQFGAAVRPTARGRPGPRRRGPYAVSFYDTPEGRWQFTRRPSGDGREWSTLSPADQPRLVRAVSELLAGTG